jgi:PrsW family intramembrane metalloprotease
VAQEGREVERLLPPSYRRIDYITMQSIADYYPSIYSYRHEGRSSSARSFCCFPPLSRLSRRIVQCFLLLVLVVFVLTVGSTVFEAYNLDQQARYRFVPTTMFDALDFAVFSMEWLETLLVMWFFSWLINRVKKSELSFDAVLKYFASGFVLAVVTAVFWEIVVGVFLKVFMAILLAIVGIEQVDNPSNYSMTGLVGGFGATKVVRRLAGDDDGAPDYLKTFGYEHPILYTFVVLIDAFVVAALIEELSKYFAYRMVEHPDFLSKNELEESLTMARHHYHSDGNDDDQNSESTAQTSFPLHNRSKQAQGAAVTLAMVSVAMGFTCCENFAYIFLYSGKSFASELGTMIVRAFFPIHPLCAALQSVGVVARDIEQERTSLGSILLPALLLHGFYDFFLLWIDFMYKRKGEDAGEEGEGVLFSWFLSTIVVIISLVYYVRQSRQQRERLMKMDEQSTVDRSMLI